MTLARYIDAACKNRQCTGTRAPALYGFCNKCWRKVPFALKQSLYALRNWKKLNVKIPPNVYGRVCTAINARSAA